MNMDELIDDALAESKRELEANSLVGLGFSMDSYLDALADKIKFNSKDGIVCIECIYFTMNRGLEYYDCPIDEEYWKSINTHTFSCGNFKEEGV